MQTIRFPAYAKVNFGLSILGKRNDGFHEIETVLQQIDLKDEIEVKGTDQQKIGFSCDHSDLPVGDSNLCVSAAKLLQQAAKVQKGVRIHLKKTIPIGAGLGGGSSNAAVVLLALNKLWGVDLSVGELQVLASELGSDIPFFILGGTAFATGKGDNLQPAKLTTNNFAFVIIFPEIAVSTKWAYGQLNLSLTIKKKNSNFMSFNDININDVDFVTSCKNEFEEVIFVKHPILGEIKRQLYESNALFASMSGSGSALYGVFRNEDDAFEVKKQFQERYQTFVARPINWGYGEVSKLI